MSIRSRLDRLEHRIGGEDVCRFCGNPHIRNLVQVIVAVESDGALCDCSMCECHRPFDEAIEHYRSKYEREGRKP